MEEKIKTSLVLFILSFLIALVYILLITLLPTNNNCYLHDFCFCESPIQGTTIQPQLFASSFSYLVSTFGCLITLSKTNQNWLSSFFVINLFCLFFSTLSIHSKLEHWTVEVFRIFLISMMSNCIALINSRINANKIFDVLLFLSTIIAILLAFFVKESFRVIIMIQLIMTCILIGYVFKEIWTVDFQKMRFLFVWLIFAPSGFLFLWIECSHEDIIHTRGIGNCFLAFSFLSLYNFYS